MLVGCEVVLRILPQDEGMEMSPVEYRFHLIIPVRVVMKV